MELHFITTQENRPQSQPKRQNVSDQLNRTGSIKYDHRNLLTYIRSIKTEGVGSPGGPVDVTYVTLFKYDEAGNRVRKTNVKYLGQELEPVYEGGDNPVWQLMSDEFYVRDVGGKEIAVYSSTNLQFWNIWGLDNVGKINADTTRNYYLKDHLGSIRVVLNSTNTIVSAQDYDAWGSIMQNRSYNSTAMKYDFTDKERDNETSYDYFGARYYDSRIGRWGGVDPQGDKTPGWSSYRAFLDNPVNILDNDGEIEIPKECKERYPKLYSYLEKNFEKNFLPRCSPPRRIITCNILRLNWIILNKVHYCMVYCNSPTQIFPPACSLHL